MWFRLQWNQLYRRYWQDNETTSFFLLFWIVRQVREYFTPGDGTILGEALNALTFAQHSWPFFNVPHLLWHGTPFIMVISKDLWHSHLSFSGQRYLQHPIKRKMCLSTLNFSEYLLREEVNSSYLYHAHTYLNFKGNLLHIMLLKNSIVWQNMFFFYFTNNYIHCTTWYLLFAYSMCCLCVVVFG